VRELQRSECCQRCRHDANSDRRRLQQANSLLSAESEESVAEQEQLKLGLNQVCLEVLVKEGQVAHLEVEPVDNHPSLVC